jgi:hypothetical protein
VHERHTLVPDAVYTPEPSRYRSVALGGELLYDDNIDLAICRLSSALCGP